MSLICNGYQVTIIKKGNEKYFRYQSDSLDVLLLNDFEGFSTKYLRELFKQEDQNVFLVKFVDGVPLRELCKQNKQIQEQLVHKIILQCLIALYNIHKQNLVGRCFTLDNILFHQDQITMMHFGLYPEVSEIIKTQYDHKIDVFLLGDLVYNLLLQEPLPDVGFNNLQSYIDLALDMCPYSLQLKELTQKMLMIDSSQRIDFPQIIDLYQKELPKEIVRFYKEDFTVISKIIDNKINKRERQGTQFIECIKFSDDEEEEPKIILKTYPYLIYYNKDIQEEIMHQREWNQIHLELYRFYLLQSLNESLERLSMDNSLLSFIVSKTKIIIMKQFQEDLEVNYKQMGNSLEVLKKTIKDFIKTESMQLSSKFMPIKNEVQNQKYSENLTLDVWEGCFDKIKHCYRFNLVQIYQLFEQNMEQTLGSLDQLIRIQLRVLLCMIINNIIKNKDHHFKTIQRILNRTTIDPQDIEYFIENAEIQNISKQIAEIENLYFKN